QPDWDTTGESGYAGWYFGNVVAAAGDVNGDGYGDILIGDDKYDNEETDEGRVLVYHGGANGLSDPQLPDWTADECDQYQCKFGAAAGAAGDFNGDGYDDVIVGAPYYSNSLHWEGAAFIYYGSAAGLSAVSDWQVESDKAEARLGAAVSAAGNVNGDGYDDVLVGSPYYEHGDEKEGISAVFFGPGDDGSLPIADFSASPLSGTAPLTAAFTNLSQNSVSYLWQFGDGSTSTQISPVHVYTQTGAYTVTLTAYGTNGLPDDNIRPNYITVTEPVSVTADFSAAPLSGTAPLTVTFANASTGADSHVWQFGDGATSTEINPTHTYTQTGI
ncbi:MAG: PKD domain-containing protein, partial [Chloroflexi bacterium]|nr:PKD domain-containing protein [Chloroflexota bacterium]